MRNKKSVDLYARSSGRGGLFSLAALCFRLRSPLALKPVFCGPKPAGPFKEFQSYSSRRARDKYSFGSQPVEDISGSYSSALEPQPLAVLLAASTPKPR